MLLRRGGFARATTARRLTVLSSRFRRFAIGTTRSGLLTATLPLATAALTLATATAAALLLTTVLNRLGFNRWIRLVARQGNTRDLFFQQAFDIMQQFMFINANQRQRFTRCGTGQGPDRAAYPAG